ncbi:MAG TPA: trypsin-like peptidase domain-containing protein [Chthoniobacterales bacterium]
MTRLLSLLAAASLAYLSLFFTLAKADPATEPSVVAVSKAMPAVVNINTERTIRRAERDPMDELYEQFFGETMRPPRRFAQKVQSLGSGFIIDPSGYIVTNEHVVERAADLKIQVTMSDGATYTAKYVTGDKDADLALIKIEPKEKLPFISIEDLSPNLLGQTVLVLGNPLGYGSSVARGILSANDRTVAVEDVEYKQLVQTDAAINPGNSGGPLIDIDGKLIGVSSVKMAYSPQGVPTQGIGFAIAGKTVRDIVNGFLKQGTKPEGVVADPVKKFFGMEVQDLTEDLANTLGYAPGYGVLVSGVKQGSSAAKAGIRRGLVIYSVGEFDIRGTDDLKKLLSPVRPGDRVDFGIGVVSRRGGLYARNVQTVSLKAL